MTFITALLVSTIRKPCCKHTSSYLSTLFNSSCWKKCTKKYALKKSCFKRTPQMSEHAAFTEKHFPFKINWYSHMRLELGNEYQKRLPNDFQSKSLSICYVSAMPNSWHKITWQILIKLIGRVGISLDKPEQFKFIWLCFLIIQFLKVFFCAKSNALNQTNIKETRGTSPVLPGIKNFRQDNFLSNST